MQRIILVSVLISLGLALACGNNPGDKQKGEIPLDAYTRVTWWDLLSEEEVTYYREENARYEADPTYQPGTDPPPVKVNNAMDKQKIKIGGYLVGVDTDPQSYTRVTSFLFVPYQGACIHVPPPPENQTIFVSMDHPVESNPFIPYFLWGTIEIDAGENEIAAFSYIMRGEALGEYQRGL